MIVNELKKLMIDESVSQKQIADHLGIAPQGMTKILNKKNLSLDDLKKILNVIGYDLDIEFIKNK